MLLLSRDMWSSAYKLIEFLIYHVIIGLLNPGDKKMPPVAPSFRVHELKKVASKSRYLNFSFERAVKKSVMLS